MAGATMTSAELTSGRFARFRSLFPGDLGEVGVPLLEALAQRVVVITDGQVQQAAGVVMALVTIAAESMTEFETLSTRRTSIQLSLNSAHDASELRSRLRTQL